MTTFAVHITIDQTPYWLTAPYWGTGQLVPTAMTEPDGMLQIDASCLCVEDVKDAIYFVDTDTALANLGALGADVRLDGIDFGRRAGDKTT